MLPIKMNYLVRERLSLNQSNFIELLRENKIDAELIINNPEYSDSLILNIGTLNIRIVFLSSEMLDVQSHTVKLDEKIYTYDAFISIIKEKAKEELERKISYYQGKLELLN